MGYLRLLLGTSLFCGLIFGSPVVKAAESLAPRAEVSVKGGSQRSMLTTEFWAPLAQKSDRVIYADVRLMGDNDENREGNLGFGYRQIYTPTKSVLGVHGWIDRRRTEHNSTFHQATIGVESLGDKIDLRANGYVPLNGARTVTLPNLGSTTPYLAGTGLYYDTNGFVNETPQYGLDVEAGYRLPVFEKHVDALRVYGGGYHFFKSGTENVTGFRIRTEAQINRLISVGARFQHDEPRGSQGFLEATLRFPFSAKKLYQKDQLRSRLDESPERDIDIVTASKVDNGLRKQILTTDSNGNAIEQRILYVNNTNANVGDGTKENPFNNLKSAEAVLQANDILYVFRGDGTSTNMDQGINITQSGITLIGSGSALTVGGFTFLNAGAPPTITNVQPSVNDYTGHGVMILGDNASVSGLTISNSSKTGVYIAPVDSNITTVNLRDLTVRNSTVAGIEAETKNGTQIGLISISNVNVNNNGVTGITLHADTASSAIKQIVIENTNVAQNGQHGIRLGVANGGTIDDISISNTTTYANVQLGIYVVSSSNGFINNFSGMNIQSNNNLSHGFYAAAQSVSAINNISINNMNALNNGGNGVYTIATNGTVGNVEFSNINASANTGNGVYIYSNGNGTTGAVKLNNIATNNNGSAGTYIYTYNTNSYMGTVTIDNITSTGNNRGIFVESRNTGTTDSITINNTITNNNSSYGINVNVYNTGTMGKLNISNNISNGNNISGVFIFTQTSGVLSEVNLSGITASSNIQQGVHLRVDGGTMNNTTINTVTTNNNSQNGVYLQTGNSSTINGLIASNVIANNNTQNGFYANAANATSIITGISLANSDMTGNGVNGIYLQKGNASATLNVDLGGGVYNSAGQNRIFNNIGKDIRLNYTGGGSVVAQHNWWGVNTGLNQGTRATLSASTTLDSSAFLTTDPRP